MNNDSAHGWARLALIGIGGIAAGIILAASIVGAHHFDQGSMLSGQDARAYWGAIRTSTPYSEPVWTFGAYQYSPAFYQALHPLLALSWPQFLGLWTAMMMGVLVLTGPVLFALALPITFFELWGGNIHPLLALTIVVGFRFPAVWGFALMTKVTPGIGLLWFAARREWRALAVALAVTGAVAAVSWTIDPRAWQAWIEMLVQAPGGAPAPGSIAISPLIRLPVAALIVVYAARTDRRWLLAVGTFVALPALWWGSLSVLIAVVALERDEIERRAADALTYLRRISQPTRRGLVAEPATTDEPSGVPSGEGAPA